MYQAMGSPAAAMFNTANMVTMANNMPAQMLPAVNQQANTGHLPQHPSQQVSHNMKKIISGFCGDPSVFMTDIDLM